MPEDFDWVMLFGLVCLIPAVACLLNYLQEFHWWKLENDERWAAYRKKEAEREAWFQSEMAKLDELERAQKDV